MKIKFTINNKNLDPVNMDGMCADSNQEKMHVIYFCHEAGYFIAYNSPFLLKNTKLRKMWFYLNRGLNIVVQLRQTVSWCFNFVICFSFKEASGKQLVGLQLVS